VEHLDRTLRIFLCGYISKFFCHDGTVPFAGMNADVGIPQKANFTTSDGVSLEGEYLIPASTRAIAVLSHPHPLYGGDMHNNVVQALFEALPKVSIATLRYNFRGVQNSGGTHGDGKLEVLDTQAAFEYAVSLMRSTPLFSVGYSFGADVSLTANEAELAGWVGIATPLALLEPTQMTAGSDERPTLLLVPENDQFRSFNEAQRISAEWAATQVEEIPRADHFLLGQTQPVVELVGSFIAETVGFS